MEPSGVKTPVSSPASGANTPRSKLDSLPKEDLIRFVKKQLIQVQKLKEKNEGLEKQVKEAAMGRELKENDEELEALRTQLKELAYEKQEAQSTQEALVQELEEIKRKFEDERISWEMKNTEMQRELEAEKKETSGAFSRITVLENESQLWDEERKNFESEISRIKEEKSEKIKTLEDVKQKHSEELRALREEQESQSEKKSNHENHIEELKQEYESNLSSKTETIVKLEEINAALLEKSRELEKTLSQSQGDVAGYLEKLSAIEESHSRELSEKKTEIQTLQEQLALPSQFEQEFESERKEYENRVATLEHQLASVLEQRDTLQTMLSQSQDDTAYHIERLAEAEQRHLKEISMLQEDSAEFQKKEEVATENPEERAQVTEENQTLRNAINERAKLCEELQDEVFRLNEELEALRNAVADQQEKSSAAKEAQDQEEDNLKHELEKKSEELDSLKLKNSSQIESLHKEEEKLRKELEETLTELRSTKDQLKLAQENNDSEYQSRVSFLERTIEEKSAEHRKKEEELKIAQLEIQYHLERIDRLTNDLEMLQKSNDEKEITISQLQSTITKSEDKISELEQHLEDSRHKVNAVEIERDGIKVEFSLLERRHENLKESLEESRNRLVSRSDGTTQTENDAELADSLTEMEAQKKISMELKKANEMLEEDMASALKAQESLKQCMEQMSTEADEKKKELIKAQEEANELKKKLEAVQENQSQQNFLNLEMADYERSLFKMQEEKIQMELLLKSKENENESLRKENETTEKKHAKSEETMTKFKRALAKMKKDLGESQSKNKTLEGELNELRNKLERTTGELDGFKLELSTNVAGSQTRVHQLETSLNSVQRQLSMEDQKECLQQELQELRKEYETYKTRVHTVLKQQGGKNAEAEEWKQERSQLQQQLHDLQNKLTETSKLWRSAQEDSLSIQEENERLMQRIMDLKTKTEQQEASLRAQLSRVQAEASQQKCHFESTIEQMKEQTEKIKKKQAEKYEVLLQAERDARSTLDDKLISMDQELQFLRDRRSGQDQNMSGHEESRENVEDDPPDLPPPFAERKPGEGQENTDYPPHPILHRPKPFSLSSDPFRSPPPLDGPSPIQTPLEDLIASDRISVSSFSVASDAQDALNGKLDKTLRRLAHTTELLNDSEEMNAKFSEQVKLLKEEIRRLQRNQEREGHVGNAEYLKNIVLKFLAPQINDERSHLVPVLKTMLRLSPEEVTLLNNIAKGDEDAGKAEGGSGWGSYLHRWSGLT